MNLSGCTALITGGGTGIGLALAEALQKEGSQVLICGRHEESLAAAAEALPGLEYKVCDVTDPADRDALVEWVRLKHPGMDVLINNAGIQREINFRKGLEELEDGENEILTNFESAIYLTAQFLPQLQSQTEAAVVNVTSGLAFVPIAAMPVYCATKAGLHSFSQSLRHQLATTSVKVFELIPPTVDTALDKGAREARGQADRGIPAKEVAAAAVAGIQKDHYEIAVGRAQTLMQGARSDPEGMFKGMNRV
jgi:uncharacterized oxidoreductase